MIKRFAFVFCLIFLLAAAAPGFFAYGAQEPATLNLKLHGDGSTSTEIIVSNPGENLDDLAAMYAANFEPMGYDVTISEQGDTLIISQHFSPEEGYFIDLLPFGLERKDFVEIKDVFTTKYGIKATVLDARREQPGAVFFKINIETPIKAFISNAQLFEKNNGLWEISSGGKNEINLIFKTVNTVTVISVIFAAAILLVLVYFGIISAKRRKSLVFDDASEVFTEDAEYDALEPAPVENNFFDDDLAQPDDDSDDLSEEGEQQADFEDDKPE